MLHSRCMGFVWICVPFLEKKTLETWVRSGGDLGNPKLALRLCLHFSYQPFPSISKPSQESRVLCAYLVANASCSSFYSVAFSAEGCLAWHWANCTIHILVLLLDIFGSVGMSNLQNEIVWMPGALRVGMSWTFSQICSGHLHLRRSHPIQILKKVKTRNELALDWSSHHQSSL